MAYFCFSCHVKLLVQVSCQYHHWFWSYDSSLFKGLTINLEIRITPIWVLPNIWRLRQVRDTNGRNVSTVMLLNAVKCQAYSFYCFWGIKVKPTGGGNIHPYFYKVIAWNERRYKTYNLHRIDSTQKWESIKNKTQNNDHNIFERKHLFVFISTSNWQPFKITWQE